MKKLFVFLFFFASLIVIAGDTQKFEELIKIEFQLTEKKAELIRNDPELLRIHQRITTLYQELDKKLLENPEIKELQEKVESLRREAFSQSDVEE